MHATRKCGIYPGTARQRARSDLLRLSPNGTRRGLFRVAFPGAFPGAFPRAFPGAFPGGFSGGLFPGLSRGLSRGLSARKCYVYPKHGPSSRGLTFSVCHRKPAAPGAAWSLSETWRGNAASIPTRPVSASGQTFLSLYNANPPHRARRGLCRRLGAKKRSLSPTQPVTAPGQTFSVCHRKPAARHVPREGWCSSSPSALPRRRARQNLNTQEVSP